MSVHTVSSRDFTCGVLAAQRAAVQGPVFITDRGCPGLALLRIEDAYRIAGQGEAALLSAMDESPGGKAIEFDPSRWDLRIQPAAFGCERCSFSTTMSCLNCATANPTSRPKRADGLQGRPPAGCFWERSRSRSWSGSKASGRWSAACRCRATLCAFLHVSNPRSERDAMIAATAIEHGFTAVTRNTQDSVNAAALLFNPLHEAAA